MCGGAVAIEHGGGGSFETYNDGVVALVGKDVTTQAIALPAKTGGSVVALRDIFPISFAGDFIVGICRHDGQIDDRFFISNVRAVHLVEGPSRGVKDGGPPKVAGML